MTTPSIEGVPRRQLVQNAIRFRLKDGTYHYLTSRYVHDYVSYGEGQDYYSTDGGLSYIHRTVDPRQEDWDLYLDDPFDLICERLLWGTYGLNPSKERISQGHLWKPLAECDLSHLKVIKETQLQIAGKMSERVVDHWIQVKESAT